MTLFHFGNCFALAYVPYFLTYKLSGLPEYGAFWKCIQAGIAYMFTQLCKMIVLATFFPPVEYGTDILADFMRSTVDLADVVGLYLVLSKIAGKGELRFLVAGVGWATAELLTTRLVPLWVGARGVEFDWKYIQMSLDSNISLIHHITVATLLWLWTQSDFQKSFASLVMVLLIISSYRSLFIDILMLYSGLNAWMLLVVKAIITLLVGLTTVHLHAHYSATQTNY